MAVPRRDEHGSAVVDFVLVLAILVPLVLGILQVALVLHVRNTLTAAASDGARQAATADRDPGDGAAYTRDQIRGVLAGKFARGVSARETTVDGAVMVEVTVRAEVPPLGLWGPSVELVVHGHAVEERP
ncbi:pilus assembly protein [Nocardioides sp. JQ2195]|uniref:TadE family protein n=1 Tax=Nocardioides sp. JQ2195 TaxID=2592334 RepID=UPI00143E23CB|nr:TadE family protein [Nocardioides sp. JQ2195]QIX25972.1 pilus assembly protein [Nocardioides sp. JQ2195]